MSASTRGAAPPGHARRAHAKSSASQSQSPKREKAKSSHAYVNPPQPESGSDQASATSTARPALKGRAYSAPIGPQDDLLVPEGTEIPEKLPSGGGGPGLGITEDPFFQRYNASRTDKAARAAGHSSTSSRDDSSGTEAPVSPISLKSASRSPNMPLSPTSSMQVSLKPCKCRLHVCENEADE